MLVRLFKFHAVTTDANGNPTIATLNAPNNVSLEFDRDPVEVFLSETNQQVVIATVRAVDMGDTGSQADIVYSIVSVNSVTSEGISSNTNGIFQIDSSKGNITASNLDAEAYINHTLVIKAYDGDIPVHSALTNVIVNVIDVNDNAPIFIGAPYIVFQEENSPVPNVVIVIPTASDADVTAPNNVIQGYSLENYQDMFRIDSNGTIKTIVPLDAEMQVDYIINISAVDGGNPPLMSYTTVELRVVDVNDNPALVNQVEPAIYVVRGGPTSIGPAISIDDPDSDSSPMINQISVEVIPNRLDQHMYTYDQCIQQCQDSRLKEFKPDLVPQSINLLDLAIFQQDQPEPNDEANFCQTTLGFGQCKAWRLERGTTNTESDGYGRILRSSLPSDFAVDDFSFSFTLFQTAEAYIILIPDQSDPSLPSSSIEHQFAIWVGRYELRLYYKPINSTKDFVAIPLGANIGLEEFFNPSSPVTHNFILVVTSSQRHVEAYVDCLSLDVHELPEPVTISSNDNIDVFIGQSRPRLTNGEQFFGTISDVYYYSIALTYDQVENLLSTCSNCEHGEILQLPLALPSSVTATNQFGRLIIEATSDFIPVEDAVSVLRSITYKNPFNFPTLDSDRRLIFTVREVIGFETTTEGAIRLVVNGTQPTVIINTTCSAAG